MTQFAVLGAALAVEVVAWLLGRGVLLAEGALLGTAARLRKAAAVLLHGFALFLLVGPLFLGLGSGGQAPEGLQWLPSVEEGRAAAKTQDKPLLVDASADWCHSCQRLKKETFTDPKVAQALRDFVLVDLDMDLPQNEKYYEELGIVGLPWIGLHSPQGALNPALTLNDYEPPEAFLARLAKASVKGGAVATEREPGLTDWLREQGFLLTLLLVFAAGMAASLTPCTYPAYFLIFAFLSMGGSGSGGSGRGRSFVLSLIVVAGTVLTYVALGIAAALGGGAVGTVFANPLVMGFIALVFLTLALASARVFSFADFSGFRTFISKRQRAGFPWAFIFGTVMGVIVAPCVGPLLVAILTLIASGQDVLQGGLLMLSFALGMGVLFLLLGASGGMIRRFLRPGKFSEAVSVVFGIFFVAAGLFYLKGIVPWAGFFGLLGLK